MKILDCTLRDGGYYNRWDFDDEIVTQYLKSVSLSGIDVIELGLRNFEKDEFLGPFAYTTERFLNQLELPDGPLYGVMVDAKTILNESSGINQAVDWLFVPAEESKIGLVRIAAHFNEVHATKEIVQKLKCLGYKVGLNLMQAGGKSSEVIADKAKLISGWKQIDVLYFADSFGNMDDKEVARIVAALKRYWSGELGIHTHNNMNLAVSNTLVAKDAGVEWLDATITGMGRGAGNAQTENLLALLDEEQAKYDPSAIYELVIRYFEGLKKEYGWGSNLLYFLGARNDIHPTYIQTLLSNTHYGIDELVGAINYLSCIDGTNVYSSSLLDSALDLIGPLGEISGESSLHRLFLDREVLIVGGGASVLRYNIAISDYVSAFNPIVLSVNISEVFDASFFDYCCITHNIKYLSESEKYKSLSTPLILPKHRFTEGELNEISKQKIYDFGFDSSSKTFEVREKFSSSPYDLTSAYALAIAICGKAKNISLVGFDGYDEGDIRQQEMIDLLSQVGEYYNEDIRSLTPTTYPVKKSSIYAPKL